MSDRSFVERLRTSGGPSHDLLVLLDQHRVMTTDQLARATETPDRTVRYRLDRLRGAGLVDQVRPGRESGSAPRHWWLRPAGARLVAGTAAGDGRRPSGLFVAHSAAIAEVWLALREHGPAAGLRLVDWWADRAGWQEWEPRSPGYGSRLRRLTPDAVALVDLAAADVVGQAAVFIEVDLASMTQVLLREKVARYLAYAADGAWEGVWPHCPPLLLLTTTPSRAATFIAAAAKLMTSARSQTGRYGGQPGRDIAAAQALVVAACGLVRSPADAVTGTVWMLPAEAAAQVTLAELLAERVNAQARAQHWHDQADAEHGRQQLAARIGAVNVDDVARLLGAPAGAVLGYAVGHRPRDLVDAEPDLVDAVLAWWDGDRADPTVAGRLREVLADRHRQEWTRQARALAAAVDQRGDRPGLCAAAAQLQHGELLSRTEVELLDHPSGPAGHPGNRARRLPDQAEPGRRRGVRRAAVAYSPPYQRRRTRRRPGRRAAAGVRHMPAHHRPGQRRPVGPADLHPLLRRPAALHRPGPSPHARRPARRHPRPDRPVTTHRASCRARSDRPSPGRSG
ncbi:replication-relaxation family protein [Salinispora mooreana]|uniref:replication-relaxation family protein n=1 Tax=Salinispora mooreana TaxID=999545 RepID=UPI000361A30E|nr:replication-relaxation family protein [Salinispora mooreana]